jgi:hypothetical protein
MNSLIASSFLGSFNPLTFQQRNSRKGSIEKTVYTPRPSRENLS